MLTLAAVAIFPIAAVSYVIVRDETRNVTRNVGFETREAAQSAQAQFPGCSTGGQLRAVAAASSPQLQAAIRSHDRKSLERFARRNAVADRDRRPELRTPIPTRPSRSRPARKPRPVDRLGRRAAAPEPGATEAPVRRRRPGSPAHVHPSEAPHPSRNAHGTTLPLGAGTGIRAFMPDAIVSHRKDAAYIRVIEAGLVALVALMLLTLVLARPLLRAFRWTEEQASEARIDSLTGLANRRALEESLAAEISRAQRFAHELAVVLLDLDRFKEINDSFGHAAGDVMLRAVGRLLTSLARQGDTVARWGGEEFVVVLPETDLAGAQRFAERLRRTIEGQAVGDMKTSASCGVATMLAEDTVEELLAAADQALYQAKSNGRNRTESAVRGPRPAAA